MVKKFLAFKASHLLGYKSYTPITVFRKIMVKNTVLFASLLYMLTLDSN